MKRNIINVVLAAGLLVSAGAAQALTFNEVENGTSFSRYFSVTPTAAFATGGTTLSLTISGLKTQFSALSFSFVDVAGLTITAKQSASDPASWQASFSDSRNTSFNLVKDTPYKVLVSGTTLNLPGAQGTVSLSSLNAVVTSVPEPETYAMLLAGLGLMAGIARRRRENRN